MSILNSSPLKFSSDEDEGDNELVNAEKNSELVNKVIRNDFIQTMEDAENFDHQFLFLKYDSQNLYHSKVYLMLYFLYFIFCFNTFLLHHSDTDEHENEKSDHNENSKVNVVTGNEDEDMHTDD